jgi:signal transduction histidine kinase
MAIDAAVSVVLLAVRQPARALTTRGAVRAAPADLEVTDDGHGTGSKRAGGGGHGLAGMRERLSLLGGELSAGPRAGGGYRVTARLPAEAAAR